MLVSPGPALARTRVQRPSSSYSICTEGDSSTGSSPHSHTTSGSGYPAEIDGEVRTKKILSLEGKVLVKLKVKIL